MLRPGYMNTMNNLYYESNSGRMMTPTNFTPIVLIVLVSFLSPLLPKLTLDNILSVIDRVGPHKKIL